MFLYQKFPIRTQYLFLNPNCETGHMFKFSSDLEKVGIEWDVAIKNGSYIEVVSDPIEITRASYGTFSVTKIRADVATDYHTIIKEFWVPTICVVKIVEGDFVEENVAQSSKLSN